MRVLRPLALLLPVPQAAHALAPSIPVSFLMLAQHTPKCITWKIIWNTHQCPVVFILGVPRMRDLHPRTASLLKPRALPSFLFHPRLFCLSSSILLFLLEMYLVSQCHSEPSKFPNLLGEPGQEQWERQLSTLQPANPKSSLRTLSDARTLPFSFLLPSFLPSSPSPSFSATPSSLSFPLTDLLSFSSN